MKVEIAAIETRITDRRQRITELRAKIEIMPEIEARLAGLARDYDQVKEMHDQLVSRLEQERLGSAAVAGDINFRVIEPPVAGFTPVAPNRPLLLVGGSVFGIGSGAGIAFLLSLLRPVFNSRRALQEFTGHPVLGSVRFRSKPSDVIKSRLGLTAYCVLLVLLVPVCLAIVVSSQQAASLVQGLL